VGGPRVRRSRRGAEGVGSTICEGIRLRRKESPGRPCRKCAAMGPRTGLSRRRQRRSRAPSPLALQPASWAHPLSKRHPGGRRARSRVRREDKGRARGAPVLLRREARRCCCGVGCARAGAARRRAREGATGTRRARRRRVWRRRVMQWRRDPARRGPAPERARPCTPVLGAHARRTARGARRAGQWGASSRRGSPRALSRDALLAARTERRRPPAHADAYPG